jgi:sulfur carrier protein
MIQVTVNGENREMPENSTVAHLVESLQLTGKRIAVEMNGEIVPKSQHATTPLNAGANLEIVVAVGGG